MGTPRKPTPQEAAELARLRAKLEAEGKVKPYEPRHAQPDTTTTTPDQQ